MTHSFNRLTTIAALDIGSSKVCCVIAKISRDKRINVVGYGYNASKGIKNGIVTDINQATLSVCNAVETAEQMANERIDRIIVNISGDKIKSIVKDATIAINKNRPVSEADITKVIEKGINKINVDEHELIHCLPTSYRLDMGDEIKDPRNIFGESLSVDILLGLVPEIQYRNLSTVIENAHLETAEKAFSAYASGLSCLVEDEKEIGATVIDIGGGSLEVAMGSDEDPTVALSVPAGAGRVTREFLPESGVADDDDLEAARKNIRKILEPMVKAFPKSKHPMHAVGTSKTIRSLARLAGAVMRQPGRVDTSIMTIDQLEDWLPRLAAIAPDQRTALPGVTPERTYQIVGGGLVIDEIMKALDVKEIEICPWALREGAILRWLDQFGRTRLGF